MDTFILQGIYFLDGNVVYHPNGMIHIDRNMPSIRPAVRETGHLWLSI